MTAPGASLGGTVEMLDENCVRERLAQVLRRETGAEVVIGALKRFPVGYSWLTYGFQAGWQGRQQELILRLGPPNGLFAPYDAAPQFITLQALRGSGMPLPQVYWHGDGAADFGAPWFICEKVAGRAPVMWGENFSDATRAALGAQLVDALAALHRFDWRGTPIAALDAGVTTANAARRQVDACASRWWRRCWPG